MGLICRPSLCDYWSTIPYMPIHKVMKELNMMCDNFFFIWYNFHVCDEGDMNVQSEEDKGTNEERVESDGIVQLEMRQEQQDQDDDTSNNDASSSSDDDDKFIDKEVKEESGEQLEDSLG
eukprot:4838924-Ditylum_brightwellii.AAC.1